MVAGVDQLLDEEEDGVLQGTIWRQSLWWLCLSRYAIKTLQQITERKEIASESDDSDDERDFEVHCLESHDSFEDHEECFSADLAGGDCSYNVSEGTTSAWRNIECATA